MVTYAIGFSLLAGMPVRALICCDTRALAIECYSHKGKRPAVVLGSQSENIPIILNIKNIFIIRIAGRLAGMLKKERGRSISVPKARR
jgi:hypothetical protein